MNALSDERGSVPLVEGSYLFPIAFLVLFLILLLSLELFRIVDREARLQRFLTQSVQSEVFQKPSAFLPSAFQSEKVSLHSENVLFSELHMDVGTEREAGTPIAFLTNRTSWKESMQRQAQWVSQANRIWHLQAINGFTARNLQTEP